MRIVTNSPHSCEYLGEVSGNFRDEKTSGGFFAKPAQAGHVNLKNNVANLGGDTVEITGKNPSDGWYEGEAYRCGRVPASR